MHFFTFPLIFQVKENDGITKTLIDEFQESIQKQLQAWNEKLGIHTLR